MICTIRYIPLFLGKHFLRTTTKAYLVLLGTILFSLNTREGSYMWCKRKHKEKDVVRFLCLCLCLCLRQAPFCDSISALVFALVLASLVKTRLKITTIEPFFCNLNFCRSPPELELLLTFKCHFHPPKHEKNSAKLRQSSAKSLTLFYHDSWRKTTLMRNSK